MSLIFFSLLLEYISLHIVFHIFLPFNGFLMFVFEGLIKYVEFITLHLLHIMSIYRFYTNSENLRIF